MLLCVIRGQANSILYGTGKKHFSVYAHHFSSIWKSLGATSSASH